MQGNTISVIYWHYVIPPTSLRVTFQEFRDEKLKSLTMATADTSARPQQEQKRYSDVLAITYRKKRFKVAHPVGVHLISSVEDTEEKEGEKETDANFMLCVYRSCIFF